MTPLEQNIVYSPRRERPVTVLTRKGTSDLSTIAASLALWGRTDDEYGLRALPELEGTALDIGAHVGSVTLALLADFPGLRVTAVEPLAENADVLRANLAANRWTDRCDIRVAGIGRGETVEVGWNFRGDSYVEAQRYIGGLGQGLAGEHDTATVPALRMRDLVTADTVFAKLDCEGCEWVAFRDKAITAIPWVVGEGHGQGWLDKVKATFDRTHEVSVLVEYDGIGTFRAVRR